MKIKEIADYINNYINEKETNNYKTFDFFVYPNFYKILCNFLNATYESSTNHILIKNFVIIIDNNNDNDNGNDNDNDNDNDNGNDNGNNNGNDNGNDNGNGNKYKVYITDNDLIEPTGPI